MTTDLGSIEDDTLDILTLRNGSPKSLSQNAYKGVRRTPEMSGHACPKYVRVRSP